MIQKLQQQWRRGPARLTGHLMIFLFLAIWSVPTWAYSKTGVAILRTLMYLSNQLG